MNNDYFSRNKPVQYKACGHGGRRYTAYVQTSDSEAEVQGSETTPWFSGHEHWYLVESCR